MRGVIILQHGFFRLTSYGNGASYTLERAGRSVFFQGDDAAQFRDEMESLENSAPDTSPLPTLWDWYSHVAE